MNDEFSVTFWGVRGTLACPGPETVRYGGNTPCVEVRCGARRLILDAGTGLRALGKSLVQSGERVDAHIFLTHTHLDHIAGLPFFKPAYNAGNRLRLWSGHLKRHGTTLSTVLNKIMERPFFPVPLNILHACIAFNDFDAGQDIDLGDERLRLHTLPLNHPGGATAYRIEFDGRSLCYVTDTEHRVGRLDESIAGFIAESDLVIYDCTYTDEEFVMFKGWGHSTWQEGVRLCKASGARRLVTFHHDPERDDEALAAIDRQLQETMPGSFAAREGMTLKL
ncbi:Phosphoribosyl 1,2-cyclic phosphodiesterase [Arboricoccus pini]|uniref:Phosphoribosyl 1,2-cyclic phosphodiesterase n=1 Tax=Arboricoccus pini TaxID=1963835 RepID=A0A212Q1U0_9PROT|nr:MBL fold metallo-hydrolase [Arboricoccus pini]SNB53128.1 Phosphoribosyl 1,2-cyclic phosphodiesterase [Arboricoccus pini]